MKRRCMKRSSITRRGFIAGAGAAAAVTVVPRRVLARSGQTPPSETLQIAGIGVGSMGGVDIAAVHAEKGTNIVALADVDWGYAAKTFKKYPAAKQFRDFRKMLDALDKTIDAVVIGTPDHSHAVIAISAMQRGKHVYCEKPLAHSIAEVRRLVEAAKKYKVATQLGNHGHSFESARMFCEWIWDGAIGDVHTIQAGCRCICTATQQLAQLKEKHPVPATLDWDLWLGPAEARPYHPAYHPAAWREWFPFGTGTIGDFGCHIIDPVNWALDLGAPATIRARVKDAGYDFKKQSDAFPMGEQITYEFAAKGSRGPITLHWYSGTAPIPRPAVLEPGRPAVDIGAVVLGSKGAIMYGMHGASGVRIIPEAAMKAYKLPPKKIPRVANHHRDWLDAIRHGGKAGCDFSYGGPLTEIPLLGVVAIKMAGTRLQWDAKNMRFPNCAEANEFLSAPYRTGWTL
jgi:predicted dehydrogenase